MDEITTKQSALALFGGIAAAVAIAAACLFASGCAYKGGKVVEGTDLAVGMDIPGTEGTAQLNVLNYLSGFRLGIDRNAALKVKYTVAESNEYFGIIRTNSKKTIDAKMEPCEDGAAKN